MLSLTGAAGEDGVILFVEEGEGGQGTDSGHAGVVVGGEGR